MGGLNPQNSPSDMMWGYVNDKGDFETYSTMVSAVIERACLSNQPTVHITSEAGHQYLITFATMTQKAMNGQGAVRTVRRFDGRTQPTYERGDIIWYWHDNDNTFKPYTAEASRQIEACFRSNQSPCIIWGTSKNSYYIDLSDHSNPYQLNEKTKYKRSIKRGNA